MFDDFSKRSKAVRAALDLAEKRGWGDTSLADIAQAAGVSLADLRREFTCKSDILRAFQHEIDAQVLAKAKAAGETQSPRDRLFDLIMTRFELMAPYKGALKRIYAYLCCRPGEASGLLCSTLASQYWMLAGAGAKLGGPGGVLRVSGLAEIYGKVFRVWLDDDTPSLDKTMAALDKRLADGERMLNRAETACRISAASLVGSCRAGGSVASAPRRRLLLHRRHRLRHPPDTAAIPGGLRRQAQTDPRGLRREERCPRDRRRAVCQGREARGCHPKRQPPRRTRARCHRTTARHSRGEP